MARSTIQEPQGEVVFPLNQGSGGGRGDREQWVRADPGWWSTHDGVQGRGGSSLPMVLVWKNGGKWGHRCRRGIQE